MSFTVTWHVLRIITWTLVCPLHVGQNVFVVLNCFVLPKFSMVGAAIFANFFQNGHEHVWYAISCTSGIHEWRFLISQKFIFNENKNGMTIMFLNICSSWVPNTRCERCKQNCNVRCVGHYERHAQILVSNVYTQKTMLTWNFDGFFHACMFDHVLSFIIWEPKIFVWACFIFPLQFFVECVTNKK